MFESVLEVDDRKAERRDKTKEHGGEERGKEGEEKNACVDGNGFAARKRSALRNESKQSGEAERGEEKSDEHAGEGEEQTFRE